MKKYLKLDYKLLAIISVIVILFLGYLVQNHYAVDTYSTSVLSAKKHALHYLNSGRIVMSFKIAVDYLLGISYNITKFTSFIIGITSLIASIYLLTKHIVKKYDKKLFTTALFSIAVILNPFILELFLFPEFSGVMCIGILSSVIASILIDNFITKKDIKTMILAIIFVTISACSYQGVMSLYIGITSIFVILHNKTFKDFIINNIFMGIPYVFATIINLLISTLGSSSRATGITNLNDTIMSIVKETKDLFITSGNMMPKYVFLISIIITFIIVILNILDKKKYSHILGLIYTVSFVILFSIMPQAISGDGAWLPPRSAYAIGSIVGLMFLFNYLTIKTSNKYNKVISALVVIFLIIQYFSFQQVILSRFINNRLDIEDAKYTINVISKYEQKNNVIINEIVLSSDMYTTYTRENIINYKDYNINAFATDFGTIGILNLYSDNKFTLVHNNKYDSYCKGINYDYLTDEAFIFEESRVYICTY